MSNVENYQVIAVRENERKMFRECHWNCKQLKPVPLLASFHGLKVCWGFLTIIWYNGPLYHRLKRPNYRNKEHREVPRCTTLVAEKAELQKAHRLNRVLVKGCNLSYHNWVI